MDLQCLTSHKQNPCVMLVYLMHAGLLWVSWNICMCDHVHRVYFHLTLSKLNAGRYDSRIMIVCQCVWLSGLIHEVWLKLRLVYYRCDSKSEKNIRLNVWKNKSSYFLIVACQGYLENNYI